MRVGKEAGVRPWKAAASIGIISLQKQRMCFFFLTPNQCLNFQMLPYVLILNYHL